MYTHFSYYCCCYNPAAIAAAAAAAAIPPPATTASTIAPDAAAAAALRVLTIMPGKHSSYDKSFIQASPCSTFTVLSHVHVMLSLLSIALSFACFWPTVSVAAVMVESLQLPLVWPFRCYCLTNAPDRR